MLPEIRPSDSIGLLASGAAIGFEAPLEAMLGDQPAALYGQGCTTEGLATLTLGTGAFLWLNVGSAPPEPPPGVLATVAWEKRAAGPTYALEAYCPTPGNARACSRPRLPTRRHRSALDWSRPHPVVVLARGLGTPLWPASIASPCWERPKTMAADPLTGARDVAHQIADALGRSTTTTCGHLAVGGAWQARRAAQAVG